MKNALLKDEYAKFNFRKYKKHNKYIRTLIIDCLCEKLGEKKGLKNSRIQLKI